MFRRFPRRHLFLAVFLFLGIIRGLIWKPHPPTGYFDFPHRICGTVGFPSDIRQRSISLILKDLTIDEKRAWGQISLFLSSKVKNHQKIARVGSRICFSEVVREIRNFGIPGEFDIRRKMLSKKIWGRVFLSHKDSIQIYEKAAFYPVQKLRERFFHYLDRFHSGGGLLKMVVLGIPAMTREQRDDFIATGLLHAVVISGQNIALLFFFSFSLLYWLFSRSEYMLLHWPLQRILVFLSSAILFFFYFFSGGEIPILRASLMAFSSLIALWSSRPQNGLYALSVATALILNFIPSSLLDPSFQLSFISVLGLCLMRFFIPDVQKNLWKTIFFSTLICTIVTAPIVIYYFHRFSLVGIAVNLIVTPLMSFLILPGSFLITFFYFISEPVCHVLMMIFEPLARWLFSFIHFFASFPFSSMIVKPPSLSGICFIYIGMVFILLFFQKRNLLKLTAVLAGLFLFFYVGGWTQVFFKKGRDLKISFLSVGQGDSTLMEFPDGGTMLVDAGGIHPHFDAGERLLAPYLWKKGIRTIDVLILTHSDFDHTDGARFLIDHFDVKEMWISQWRGGIHYERILELSEMKNIPIYLISKETGAKIFKGVEFQFLNPKNVFEKATDNHQSIVFRCRYKNFSILFTADIERDVEEEISYFPLQSTLLKVPHHGSKTSSSLSFLRAVKPKFAVISSGYANRFGHPHDEALRRYRDLGIALFRTDQHGTVEIRTDGDFLSIVQRFYTQ